jgi:hypothetical protein
MVRRRKRAAWILLPAAIAVCLGILLGSRWWPFAERPILQTLGEASDSQVQVRGFHPTYFPYPGCILDGVTFIHGKRASQPLITIDKLTIRGSYTGILARHVSLMKADGMRVFVSVSGARESLRTTRSATTVGEIVANGAILEFARNGDTPPLRFDVQEISLRNVGWSAPFSYRLKMRASNPLGEIAASGKFGVWNQDDPALTPLSGEYKLKQADLSIYPGIAGMLSSSGKFNGKLGHIDVEGTTDTPDFSVKSTGHSVRVRTDFNAYVDGTNGDTFLKNVHADFGKTQVIAEGRIAKTPDGTGKSALIDLSTENGRIEDLLGLFVKRQPAPMSGAVSLLAHAEIPPGNQAFLRKLVLRGSFGIDKGAFSKPGTQEQVNDLSAGARGEKQPESVLTNLAGQVNIENGIARFVDLSFGVPGASARMRGTFDLIGHKIDLHGQMQVASKISNTTKGAKGVLLGVMETFFKKRKEGEILPVKIVGTYEKPAFGLDVLDPKAQAVKLPGQVRKANQTRR